MLAVPLQQRTSFETSQGLAVLGVLPALKLLTITPTFRYCPAVYVLVQGTEQGLASPGAKAAQSETLVEVEEGE